MIIRKLEAHEYGRLADIEEGFQPNPETSIAVVAEDGGKIVGRMLLVVMPHIEGTWIDEKYRNGSIGYRMEREVERQSRELGVSKVMAYAPLELAGYMERLGFRRLNIVVLEKGV